MTEYKVFIKYQTAGWAFLDYLEGSSNHIEAFDRYIACLSQAIDTLKLIQDALREEKGSYISNVSQAAIHICCSEEMAEQLERFGAHIEPLEKEPDMDFSFRISTGIGEGDFEKEE